jgi:hypothetical protein
MLYTLHLKWADDAKPADDPLALEASNLEDAKLEAALIYAMSEFADGPPPSYLIVSDDQVVYRYPEVGLN